MFNFNQIDSKLLLESLGVGIVVHAHDTQILYANPRALDILRITYEQATGRDAFDPNWQLIDSNQQPINPEKYPVSEVIKTKNAVTNRLLGIVDSHKQDVTWVLVNAYPQIISESDETFNIMVSFVDVTDQQFDIPFESVVADSSDIVLITEADPITSPGPRVVYANRAFSKQTGYNLSDILGKSPRILQGKNSSPEVLLNIKKSLENKKAGKFELINYKKNGQPFWVELNIFPLKNVFGNVSHFAAVETDITDKKLKEIELRKLAETDSLTGIMNRRAFEIACETAIASTSKRNLGLVFAIIDIDNFKQINDIHGHLIGDDVLMLLSKTMKHNFRKTDYLGRIGGDEFCILMIDITNKTALTLLENLMASINKESKNIQQINNLNITLSIGASRLINQRNFNELLSDSDKNLLRAKALGKNQVIIT